MNKMKTLLAFRLFVTEKAQGSCFGPDEGYPGVWGGVVGVAFVFCLYDLTVRWLGSARRWFASCSCFVKTGVWSGCLFVF
jgi:hypothetical protein